MCDMFCVILHQISHWKYAKFVVNALEIRILVNFFLNIFPKKYHLLKPWRNVPNFYLFAAFLMKTSTVYRKSDKLGCNCNKCVTEVGDSSYFICIFRIKNYIHCQYAYLRNPWISHIKYAYLRTMQSCQKCEFLILFSPYLINLCWSFFLSFTFTCCHFAGWSLWRALLPRNINTVCQVNFCGLTTNG